jgi:hypothetical protein
MKKIPLSVTGKKYAGMYEALVDDEWYDYLMQWSWSILPKNENTIYAKAIVRDNKTRHIIKMHRVVTGVADGEEVDHIDGNGLNNQSHNLRICNRSQNTRNQHIRKNNKSGYKGVCAVHYGKFSAQIMVNRKQIYLGRFETAEEASLAYNEACVKYHGEFARPNP